MTNKPTSKLFPVNPTLTYNINRIRANNKIPRQCLTKEILRLPQIPKGCEDIAIAKADSGASYHYFRPEDTGCLEKEHVEIGPPVTLPDGEAHHQKEQHTSN